MKTQLLEDIGQSATLTLVPSGKVLNATAENLEQDIAQALAAMSDTPRPVFGVWRQKPASEPIAPANVEPEQQAAPLQAVHEDAVAPVEHTFAADPPPTDQPPRDPLFEFTVPWSSTPAEDVFKPEPSWFERWGARYLLPGLGMLAAALVILGGLWFYEERKDATALALVADEVKAQPQVNKAVQVAPVAAPTVPPMVLLKPEPAAVAEPDNKKVQASHEPEQAAEPAPVAPLPKRVRRAERAPVVLADAKSEPVSGTTAMLKACREHGYQAAQCVKRACSMTKYGFVCRGK